RRSPRPPPPRRPPRGARPARRLRRPRLGRLLPRRDPHRRRPRPRQPAPPAERGLRPLHRGLTRTSRDRGRQHRREAPTGRSTPFATKALFHAYGFGNNLTFPYWVGATTVLHAGRHSPATVLETIEKRRPTLFFSAPTLYNAILNFEGAKSRDLSSIRHCVAA